MSIMSEEFDTLFGDKDASDLQVFDVNVAMGIYDAPQTQEQPIFYLNPYKSNTVILGGTMTGKTTFIKTLLVRLHEKQRRGPKESIYIIDFGGNIGKYGALENVCACFDNSNEENIKRIFKTLAKKIVENAETLGSSNYYSVLNSSPDKCPAHITLIIEHINSFLLDERYSTYQDKLLKLCRDGISKGLNVVLTANDMSGIGRLLTNFGQKIAFEMPADSYFEIFNSKVNKPMRLPGRGLVNIDNSIYEFQCFLPFAKDEEIDTFLKYTKTERNKDILASFGNELTLDNYRQYLTSSFQHDKGDQLAFLGLDYYEHKPICINMKESRSIAIYGKRQFGKTNLLKIILREIYNNYNNARIVYFDDGRKELEKVYGSNPKAGIEEVYLSGGIEGFKEYLINTGYVRIRRVPMPGQPAEGNQTIHVETPFTIFVLQSKTLFQRSEDVNFLMSRAIPEMISSAEEKGYLFIFSDVKVVSAPDVRVAFNNCISTAILLDNIGDFVADKGSQNKSVFGEMEARELKAEFAKCSVGDGYYYDVEADILQKVRFLKC
jgi:DNA segregation ATPase ftsK/spoIIIE and related proteins